MALSCKPKLLIADEPTTALDVTIQAQILELLRRLQQETHLSVLLITHDLGVVAENADTVAVMYASKVVEFAPVEELFDSPQHPYTQGLFRSVPRLDAAPGRLQTIAGAVPNPAAFPPGCKFHTRCPLTRELATGAAAEQTVQISIAGESVRVMQTCRQVEPELRQLAESHWAACHYAQNYPDAFATTPRSDHRRATQLASVNPPEALT
jgi:oligopeptide/dipeptide ABC transporter ATP-binding protein